MRPASEAPPVGARFVPVSTGRSGRYSGCLTVLLSCTVGYARVGPAAAGATSDFATALVAAFATAYHEVTGMRPDAPGHPAPA